VVLNGNIGKFSQGLRQLGNGLSLLTRRMTDDDVGDKFAAGARRLGVLCGAGNFCAQD
jgi:hypothetical protein